MIPTSYYRDKCFHSQFQFSSKVVSVPYKSSLTKTHLLQITCKGYTSYFILLRNISLAQSQKFLANFLGQMPATLEIFPRCTIAAEGYLPLTENSYSASKAA